MTKAIAQTYTLAHEYAGEYRKYIVGTLSFICGVLVVLYALNVYGVISHTVALQKAQAETVSLGTAIKDLDIQYLSLSSRITPDSLHAYGMSQGQATAFITRQASLGRAVSIAHEF